MKKLLITIQDKFNLLVIIMIAYMLISTLIYTADIAINVPDDEYVLAGFSIIPVCLMIYFVPVIYDWFLELLPFIGRKTPVSSYTRL